MSTSPIRKNQPGKTESEKLFELYLEKNGFSEFDFEPPIPGKKKHPDYRLPWLGDDVFVEIKELREKRPRPGRVVTYDPYRSLRNEIHDVRKQLKEYRESCCCLVVHNIDDWEADLDPDCVFAAMLGDLGILLEIDVQQGGAIPGSGRQAFLCGGKMIAPKTGDRQNTTISAILVLEKRELIDFDFNTRFEHEVKRFEAIYGSRASAKERLRLRISERQKQSPTRSNVPRISVFKNPYARIALPTGMFEGRFDEVYEYSNSQINKVFSGDEISKLQ